MKRVTIEFPGKGYEEIHYPGGEWQIRFNVEQQKLLKEADQVDVRATIQDGEIMRLALLSDALHSCMNNLAGAEASLILPYLPYARADRRFVPGDCFGLQTFGMALNDMDYDKVITLDVHSALAKSHIFNLFNVSPTPIINSVIEGGFYEKEKLAILLPDKGAKRYNLQGRNVFQCDKKRDAATGKLSGFVVPNDEELAPYESLLIVDDICDGGRTFIGMADKLPSDKKLYLYVTHGIFSKGLQPLLQSFDRIYTTDSLPRRHKEEGDDRLCVIPCGGTILAELYSPAELWDTVAKGDIAFRKVYES